MALHREEFLNLHKEAAKRLCREIKRVLFRERCGREEDCIDFTHSNSTKPTSHYISLRNFKATKSYQFMNEKGLLRLNIDYI